jgi:hypothetical protein
LIGCLPQTRSKPTLTGFLMSRGAGSRVPTLRAVSDFALLAFKYPELQFWIVKLPVTDNPLPSPAQQFFFGFSDFSLSHGANSSHSSFALCKRKVDISIMPLSTFA